MKVEMAALGSPSSVVLNMLSVDVKQHLEEEEGLVLALLSPKDTICNIYKVLRVHSEYLLLPSGKRYRKERESVCVCVRESERERVCV